MARFSSERNSSMLSITPSLATPPWGCFQLDFWTDYDFVGEPAPGAVCAKDLFNRERNCLYERQHLFAKEEETMSKMKRRFAIAGVIITVACFALITSAQQSVRGSITGTVSADEGQVHAFRVGAHNLDRGLWYTVFTKNGQYTVPQALPGLYELMVEEPGYISPKVPVYVIPGEQNGEYRAEEAGSRSEIRRGGIQRGRASQTEQRTDSVRQQHG